MKNNNKFGFSIMELTITTVMIAVILVIAPVVILKRAVKPKENGTHKTYIAACQTKCLYDANDSILKRVSGEEKEVYDYIRNSDNIYTIRLIGGGGGGTATSNGIAGEDRLLQMHSMFSNKSHLDTSDHNSILTGYYLMEVGEGGNPKYSGQPSVFCIITEEMAKKNLNTISCNDSKAIIIAKAMGGITSNEEGGNDDDKISGGLEGTFEDAGNGGKKNKKGNAGVIIIE